MHGLIVLESWFSGALYGCKLLAPECQLRLAWVWCSSSKSRTASSSATQQIWPISRCAGRLIVFKLMARPLHEAFSR